MSRPDTKDSQDSKDTKGPGQVVANLARFGTDARELNSIRERAVEEYFQELFAKHPRAMADLDENLRIAAGKRLDEFVFEFSPNTSIAGDFFLMHLDNATIDEFLVLLRATSKRIGWALTDCPPSPSRWYVEDLPKFLTKNVCVCTVKENLVWS